MREAPACLHSTVQVQQKQGSCDTWFALLRALVRSLQTGHPPVAALVPFFSITLVIMNTLVQLISALTSSVHLALFSVTPRKLSAMPPYSAHHLGPAHLTHLPVHRSLSTCSSIHPAAHCTHHVFSSELGSYCFFRQLPHFLSLVRPLGWYFLGPSVYRSVAHIRKSSCLPCMLGLA